MVEILQFKAPELPLMYIEQYVDSRLEVYPEVVNQSLSVHQIWKRLKNQDKNDQIFVLCANEQMVGWLQLSKKEDQYWFNMLVLKDKQGLGLGSRLLDHVKELVPNLHGWVIPHNNYLLFDGEPYYSPLKFYEKCEFVRVSDTVKQNDIEVVEVAWKKRVR